MGNKGGKEKGRKLSGRKEDAGRGSTAGVAEFGSSLVLTDGTSSSGAPPQTKEERLNVVNSYKALNERALSDHRSRLQHVTSHEDLKEEFHRREVAAAALKAVQAADWLPEYRPVSIIPPQRTPDTVLERSTRISRATIFKTVPTDRKVKILCTLGPASWSEEGLGSLIDAGMNVARFNFSHGTHQSHQEVLDRLRKVNADKGKTVGLLLDTKGPEIRTAMLKGGKDIYLDKGQDVTVYAAGVEYTTWEGYKDEKTGETKIGLSYAKLCQSVKPGNIILIADGEISIQVTEITSDKELKGKVINSHKLGQRKNCNLPGVHVDLPVLAPNDINDVQNFACKNNMDFIAASFVQKVEDVQLIRKVLKEAGGEHIKIISKIENEIGLRNIDDIIQETDGIMVARGDLAMEVPAEKIALAQKMIIAKCMLAGKFVVTATQMLESMINNPVPTRAEMTDVANAVFDGTDAVMLSGESANGKWPDTAVSTMASIVQTAELALDYSAQLDWIRVNNYSKREGPLTGLEAMFASVSMASLNLTLDSNDDGVLDASEGCLIIVFTHTGFAANLVAKFRPCCPVIAVSDQASVLRGLAPRFGIYPCPLPPGLDKEEAVQAVMEWVRTENILWDGLHVLTLTGADGLWADNMPELTCKGLENNFSQVAEVPDAYEPQRPSFMKYHSPFETRCITPTQTLRIGPDLIINPQFNFRGTKIIATLGPSCWSPDGLKLLYDKGVSVVRVNLSLCESLDQVQRIIESWKQVVDARTKPGAPGPKPYTPKPALMCSIKGPEIRTSMLKDGKALELNQGDKLTLVAFTDPKFRGSKDSETSATVGISYPEMYRNVKPGQSIMLADGSIVVKVNQILSDKQIVCTVLQGGKLEEAMPVDFPFCRLTAPYLGPNDKAYLQFCAKHHNDVDFVTLPYVQSPEDVMAVRKILDESGGAHIQLITQIDNTSAINNFDSILEVSDGIMVSRNHLGLRMTPQKVCMAQKWLISKANLKGVPIIVAAQMLESMVSVPRPTRAEMTDVANALYDGADAILLRSETALGAFVDRVMDTAVAILRDAEVGIDNYANYNYIRNFTPKPMSALETVCSSAVKAALDMQAALVAVVCNALAPVRLITKYRPNQTVVVCTTKPEVARQCNINFGTIPLLLPSTKLTMGQIRDRVIAFARQHGLALFNSEDDKSDQLVIVSGPVLKYFVEEEDLAEMEFVTMVVGDEASELVELKGYVGEDTIAYRSTKVGLDLVCDPIATPRKTKILCTLGPASWSEEGLAGLLDAGMNVARFNFSHGTHKAHQEVLDRLRQVAAAKGMRPAYLLDTKGPEIRTAMLKDHKPIDLEAGQEITVVSVGDAYDTWEGYKDPSTGETKIGLSYPHLCQDVFPGSRILIGDGAISVEVTQILSDKELKAKVLNSKQLGERKNCNLPHVKVRLPVLTAHDIEDVQKFACKNHMDFIAASFVQCADDVRFIRKVLDDAGGKLIKIISKIESSHGLQNYDDILRESDGIMVARGDLAMEIPSEKVALAQKMMITKANIAGKFVITATQMLESMVSNPLPTRAEMTDVANAVFDGTDAVMLSGETANGKFPTKAVATMAAIVANAEVGVNYYQTYDFIRDFTAKPMSTKEAVLGCATQDAIDIKASMIIVVTSKGDAARMIVKYRPPVPVLVVTNNERVVRQCSPVYALHPYLVDTIPFSRDDVDFEIMLEKATIYACETGLCEPGMEVVVVHGCLEADAETMPMVTIKAAPGVVVPTMNDLDQTKTLSLRTTAISLSDVLSPDAPPRKTKIVCTLGPASWSEEGLGKLIDAGMNVARFNFSHGTHESHQEVLDRLSKVMGHKHRRVALLLDTKGPEVRTAMTKDGKDIDLVAGQDVILVAVGDKYDTWEGYKDPSTGETKIGISYAKLCQSVGPGKRILMADGSLVIEVLEILSDTELRGRCLNGKALGPKKNVNLPGVHVDIPVLTAKDVSDLQDFCCKNKMDFVAASFVQHADDVRYIRAVLDEAGGQHVKIICKIENEAGLENYDEILKESDGIMVARGDLAMEIPSEKVALAQKMMITKANIAGKFVITATQMLESMVSNPLPTRAEMTDVANAVFDSTDAVMLSGETANGKFPDQAVATMAAIVRNAENTSCYNATMAFIRDHSSRPFTEVEALGSALASTTVECNAQLIIIVTNTGAAARMVAKYRPSVPQMIITTDEHVANQCCITFGHHPVKVSNMDLPMDVLVMAARTVATQEGLWSGEGMGVLLLGRDEPSADKVPVMRVVDLAHMNASDLLRRRSSFGNLSRMFSLRV